MIKAKIKLITIFTMLSIFLAACGNNNASSHIQSSTPPTPTPPPPSNQPIYSSAGVSASPSITDMPAPTAKPAPAATPSKALVNDDNTGIFCLGMSKQVLLKELEQRNYKITNASGSNISIENHLYDFRLDNKNRVQDISSHDETCSGLKIGDTMEEMVRLYGPDFIDIGSGEPGEDSFVYKAGDYTLIVNFFNKKEVVSGWEFTSEPGNSWDFYESALGHTEPRFDTSPKDLMSEGNKGTVYLGMPKNDLLKELKKRNITVTKANNTIHLDTYFISFNKSGKAQYVCTSTETTDKGLRRGDSPNDMARLYGTDYLTIPVGPSRYSCLYSMGGYAFIVDISGDQVSGWTTTNMKEYQWDTMASHTEPTAGTPSPAPGAASALDLVHDDNSGAIAIGMSKKKVLKALLQKGIGSEEKLGGLSILSYTITYDENTKQYGIDTSVAYTIGFDKNDIVDAIYSSAAVTGKGLRPGDSRDDALRLYGQQYVMKKSNSGMDTLVYPAGKNILTIELAKDNKTVFRWYVDQYTTWEELVKYYGIGPQLTVTPRPTPGAFQGGITQADGAAWLRGARFTLGMSKQEVFDIAGKNGLTPSRLQDTNRYIVRGIEFYFDDSDELYRMNLSQYAFTERGLKYGDTLETLKALYGKDPVVETWEEKGGYTATQYRYMNGDITVQAIFDEGALDGAGIYNLDVFVNSAYPVYK